MELSRTYFPAAASAISFNFCLSGSVFLMLSKCAAAIPAWNESRSTFLPFISTNITPFLVLVARTGIEPVVSALRGRRVKPITLPGHFGHSIALQRLWAILRKITPGSRNARLPQYANHRQDVRFRFFDSLHRVFPLTVGIPARYPSAGRRVPCWRRVAPKGCVLSHFEEIHVERTAQFSCPFLCRDVA